MGDEFFYYDSDDKKKVYEHVVKYFGEVDTYYSAKEDDLVQADLCIIKPKKNKHYYTIVTIGMGAYKMNVPDELEDLNLSRAELVMYLPETWSFESSDMNFIWPLKLIKKLTTYAKEHSTFLALSEVINCNNPFAKNTYLQGVALSFIKNADKKAAKCVLDTDEVVNFYQLIPLYQDEMEYKKEFGNSAFMLKVNAINPILNINRKCFIDRDYIISYDEKEHIKQASIETIDSIWDIDYLDTIIDHAYSHILSIKNKNLPLDTIVAYNHIANILRFFIEKDLLRDDFKEEHQEACTLILNKDDFDLRYYIKFKVDSRFDRRFLNEKGLLFADYTDINPSLFSDVDNNAIEYFGYDKYQSPEFDDEAYLFVPYDESYYQNMKKLYEEHFEAFLALDKNIENQNKDLFNAIAFMCTDKNKKYLTSDYSKSEDIAKFSYIEASNRKDRLVSMLKKDRRTILRNGVFSFALDLDEDLFIRILKHAKAYKSDAPFYINNIRLRAHQAHVSKSPLNIDELCNEALSFIDTMYSLRNKLLDIKSIQKKTYLNKVLKNDFAKFEGDDSALLLSKERALRILDNDFVALNIQENNIYKDTVILREKCKNPAFIMAKYDVSLDDSVLDNDKLKALVAYLYREFNAYPIFIHNTYIEFCIEEFVGYKVSDLAYIFLALKVDIIDKHIKDNVLDKESLLKELINLRHFRLNLMQSY